jgi:lysophospholipase L1-like esterase
MESLFRFAEHIYGYGGAVELSTGSLLPPRLPLESGYPADTSVAAEVPAGVRLEFEGDLDGIELDVSMGDRHLLSSPNGSPEFSVWSGERHVGNYPVGKLGVCAINLRGLDSDGRLFVYVPENRDLSIHTVRVDGRLPRDISARPRLLAYGDSITQGWSASDPGLAWPSLVGRRLGLDVVNLGFAGAARGEKSVARHLAASAADIVTIAWGTNCWSSVPFDVARMRRTMTTFVESVRHGHPDVPIVVLSPILRPDAEAVASPVGATLGELRDAIEEMIRYSRDVLRDSNLYLVGGRDVVSRHHLVDGIHPGDEGHREIADAMGAVIAGIVRQ